MKIQKNLTTFGSDFTALMVCESCGTTAKLMSGYNDAFYHNHVIPCINCPTCDRNHYGESSELGAIRRKREGVNGTVGLSDVHEYEHPGRAEDRADDGTNYGATK